MAEFVKKVQLLPGLYELPSEEELAKCYKRRGVLGITTAKDWVSKCKAVGRKPSIAGDIWGQGDISILAIIGYAIFDHGGDEGWVMEEVVLGVVKFSKLKHTGAHILDETQKALSEVPVGLTSMYDDVWRKVSDAGSNMKKGWRGFDSGNQTCADHKIERSVVIYMAEPEALPLMATVIVIVIYSEP